MTIRVATEDDLHAIYGLFSEMAFDHIRGYDTIVDKERIRQSLEVMVKARTVYLAQTADGVVVGGMAGAIFPSMFSNDIIMCSMFFYLNKDSRQFTAGFLKQLEQLLEKTGVTRLVIGNPEFNHGPEMERWYLMQGFKKLETHYIKAV